MLAQIFRQVLCHLGRLAWCCASVVNALSSLVVEIAREKLLYRQSFHEAHDTLNEIGTAPNRRGTTVTFTPDTEIFGEMQNFV